MQPRSAAGYGSERLHKGRRDNVGKGHRPAGTGDNLQRPRAQRGTGGAGRAVVWRMSPYERRRGGNAPPGGSRGRPGAGNTRSGQRGSGHSVATTSGYAPDAELDYAGPASWRRGDANSTASGRRVRQHRSFAPWGKARPEKWRAEPRPEPDSGNPTVRDRRGASGNAASWRDDLHAARAPDFYLDNCTSGSEGRAEVAAHSRRLPRPDTRGSGKPATWGRARTSSMHVEDEKDSDECRRFG